MSVLAGLRERLASGNRSPAMGVRLPRALASVGPIGLYGSEDGLQLLQLERVPDGVRVRAQASIPLDEVYGDDADGRALRATLRSSHFRGRRVVAALDAPDVKLMVFDRIGAEGDEEGAAILRLVAERFEEPAEQLVVDYLPIRDLKEGTGPRSALVAVAREDVVIDRLERLRRAGLEVQALEIAPVATRRLITALGERGQEENALVLYAGRRRGHLIVLWGRRLVLYRELDLGAATMEERLAKALELPPEEAGELLRRHGVMPPEPGEAGDDLAASMELAGTIGEILKPSFYQLADQLERAMVYTASRARGAAPDRAYLVGAFGGWPRADRLLESLAPLPVRTLDADALGGVFADPDGAASVAAGLALRGLIDDG